MPGLNSLPMAICLLVVVAAAFRDFASPSNPNVLPLFLAGAGVALGFAEGSLVPALPAARAGRGLVSAC